MNSWLSLLLFSFLFFSEANSDWDLLVAVDAELLGRCLDRLITFVSIICQILLN